jgi:starch phosphorylase
LHSLAANLRWTWHGPTHALLATLPGASTAIHALQTIAEADPASLNRWLDSNAATVDQLSAELAALTASAPAAEIAYFSPEFGVAAQVPQYSGGLGILAGDHLKAASDLALPLVGVGLLYRQGFFRQEIVDGAQTERYEVVEPDLIGAVDTGHLVTVEIGGHDVACRVWLQRVGATPLVLLDSDVAGNSRHDRAITDRLYSGDRRHRLEQELVLGIGGVRALRALGIAPTVFHLNEGHAAFLLLELLVEHVEAGATLDEAIGAVRAQTLFTTHTPVPAGIDRFEPKLVGPAIEPWVTRLGTSLDTVLSWSVLPEDGPKKPFNAAAFAFELCGRANGVSQLHASVSRELFSSLHRAARVTGITNGVHARTWVDPSLQHLYDETLGAGWENGDAEAWSRVPDLDGGRYGEIRIAGRRALTDLVAAATGTELDPQAPVFGFARRFATYKRAALMLTDPYGLDAALDAGAQFVFAGKAHPADDEGKAVLAEVAAFAGSSESRGRFVIVPDYDIVVAQAMYAGCDVWLNNPIRPREACGTSGEKAALNGGLNCSILDGWWADWFVDGIGWAIPTSHSDVADVRDQAEAIALNALLTDEVLPLFADPDAWWRMVRTMLAHLGPLVTAGRMVSEYDKRFYAPIRNGVSP